VVSPHSGLLTQTAYLSLGQAPSTRWAGSVIPGHNEGGQIPRRALAKRHSHRPDVAAHSLGRGKVARPAQGIREDAFVVVGLSIRTGRLAEDVRLGRQNRPRHADARGGVRQRAAHFADCPREADVPVPAGAGNHRSRENRGPSDQLQTPAPRVEEGSSGRYGRRTRSVAGHVPAGLFPRGKRADLCHVLDDA